MFTCLNQKTRQRESNICAPTRKYSKNFLLKTQHGVHDQNNDDKSQSFGLRSLLGYFLKDMAFMYYTLFYNGKKISFDLQLFKAQQKNSKRLTEGLVIYDLMI